MRSDQETASADQATKIDGSRLRDAMTKLEEGRASRRSFFKNMALATGTTSAVLAGAATSEAGTGSGSNNQVLPYQSDPNWVKFHFQNIINNETNHLSSLLRELGAFARPKPTFVNITASNLTQYVQMGSLFCSTGAGAYLGASPYIMNPQLMMQAGSIGQVELTQSGYLNTLLDQTFLPGGSPYAIALTLQQVLDRAAPYVSSLNGGPLPLFSTTEKSVENDIAIFNVALILEYLEVEFYTLNYPKIFPS